MIERDKDSLRVKSPFCEHGFLISKGGGQCPYCSPHPTPAPRKGPLKLSEGHRGDNRGHDEGDGGFGNLMEMAQRLPV
jgi:hypothetical protein